VRVVSKHAFAAFLALRNAHDHTSTRRSDRQRPRPMTVVAMTVVARFKAEYTEADLPEIKFNPDGVLGTTEEVLAALEKDPKKGVAIMTEASANRTTGAIACHLTPHHAAPSRDAGFV